MPIPRCPRTPGAELGSVVTKAMLAVDSDAERATLDQCRAERILGVDERSGIGSAADVRGARHRFRAVESSGSGFLAGKVDRAMTLDPVSDLRATFRRFSRRHERTIGLWSTCWPGSARRRTRLEENVGAVNVQLTRDDLREIESGFSQIAVRGPRPSRNTGWGCLEVGPVALVPAVLLILLHAVAWTVPPERLHLADI